MDAGLNAADIAPETTTPASSTKPAVPVPREVTMPSRVGIRVGMTTPVVEEKNDRIEAVRDMMGAAVTGLMTLSSAAEIISMPPAFRTTFIRTPMPVIRSSVPQGTFARAFFSSEVLSAIRTAATAKEARPTLIEKPTTMMTITTIPRAVMTCSLLIFCATAVEETEVCTAGLIFQTL